MRMVGVQITHCIAHGIFVLHVEQCILCLCVTQSCCDLLSYSIILS